MGRSSKWYSLARKAKAFVSLKGLKGLKKKLGETNGILLVPRKEELHSSGQILEEKSVEVQQEAAQEETSKTEECVITSNSPPSSSSSHNLEENVDGASTPTRQKSHEELAAVKIQAAFRGSTARKKVKAMKALRRLQSMLHGRAASKQTSSAMRCIQSFAKMQSQVRFQRARFQNQQPREDQEKIPEEEQVGDWDDSTLSKDQIRAKIQIKHAAAVKRERTLAYAFSHQQWRSYPKDSSPPNSSSSDDDEKPAWSWSWLEQWMTSRTWESLEEPKPASSSPARLPAVIQSPGRSKLQVPAPYKKIVADIQPKFSPGSPNTRFGAQAQRKFSSISSPSRIQAQSKSAKVHNDSGEEKSIASIKPGNLKDEEIPEVASAVDTRKKNRTLLAKTNGIIGHMSSPGRSPRVPKRIP